MLEEDLVQQAVTGDQQAFAHLYDTYFEKLYRFIYSRVNNQQQAEDLTSQVFIKAWEKITTFRPQDGSFRAWIYRIARNLVIDHYRTQKEITSLEVVEYHLKDDQPGLLQHTEQQIQYEMVMQKMQLLPEEHKQILILKFFQGLNSKEIGEIMGKRPGAVRAMQMRALQGLAEAMEGHRD